MLSCYRAEHVCFIVSSVIGAVQNLVSAAAGQAAFASAASWLHSRLSMSSGSSSSGSSIVIGRGQHQDQGLLALSGHNPLQLSSRIRGQLSLDGALLHALLSSDSPSSRGGLRAALELGTLRTWSRLFPESFFSGVDDEAVTLAQIVHAGDLAARKEVAGLAERGASLLELFWDFLTVPTSSSSSGPDAGSSTARRQSDPFFAALLVSWGIPSTFRLPPSSGDTQEAAQSLRTLMVQCARDLLSKQEGPGAPGEDLCSVCGHLEVICQHIVRLLYPRGGF